MGKAFNAVLLAVGGAFAGGSAAQAAVTITSGDLSTVTTGVELTSATNVVPPNLASSSVGSVAFANSVLSGYTQHQIPHLNDGLYGNSNSWIGTTPQTVLVNPVTGGRTTDTGAANTQLSTGFAGVTFNAAQAAGQTATITGFSLSRDNLSDPNGNPDPHYSDRDAGDYYIQYTTSPLLAVSAGNGAPTSTGGNDPTGDSDSLWTTIGVIHNDGAGGDQDVHNFTLTTPVTGATGFRVVVPVQADFGTATDIDEIQVQGLLVSAPEPASLGLLAMGSLGLLARRRRN